jgi:carboxyl-terminal processing protease
MSVRQNFGKIFLLFFLLLIWDAQALIPREESPSLDGVWRLRGYGRILSISQNGYANYDTTTISCQQIQRGTLDDFKQLFDRFENNGKGQLFLYSKGGITRYAFDKLAALPELCQKGAGTEAKDPVYNFEVFWHAFKENYAFFKLHNVDWDNVYKTYRPRVTAKTTDDELIVILSEIIKSLDDPHVSLIAGSKRVSSVEPDAMARVVSKEFGSLPSRERYFKVLEKLRSVMKNDFLNGNCRMAANNMIVWGKIKPNIGYLNVFVMGGYAGLEASRTENIAALKETMDRVMEEFREVEAVVVDVRFNTGGYDELSMMIANRFADRKRLAFTQKAVYGSGFTPTQEFYVQPEGKFQFTGPTYLLTSERTISAAEIFTLCMMAYPHVTRIGDTTAGAFSATLTKRMPNGWRADISNEIYEAANGIVYEGKGIPPQFKVPVFDPENFYPGLKLAVDKAISLAREDTK